MRLILYQDPGDEHNWRTLNAPNSHRIFHYGNWRALHHLLIATHGLCPPVPMVRDAMESVLLPDDVVLGTCSHTLLVQCLLTINVTSLSHLKMAYFWLDLGTEWQLYFHCFVYRYPLSTSSSWR